MRTSSKVKLDAICLNPHTSYLEREIDDMDIADEDFLVIELPAKMNTWILQPLSS
jgi:hypothetical protein